MIDYQFASYDPRYRAQLIDLFTRVFGGKVELNDAYFAWKYEQNPYLTEPLFTLALHGGRVVGMRGFYGARWTASDAAAAMLAPVGADTAVNPEHRGRWLFEEMGRRALADLAARGIAYAFNFSANQTVRALSLRSGWQQLASYDPWQRRAAPEALPHRWVGRVDRRWHRWRTAASPEFAALDRAARQRDLGVAVSHDPRPEAMAALVARTRAGRLGHLGDAAYYAWRFRDPRSEFRFVYLEHGAALAGFLVFQRQRHGPGWVNIVDWAIARPEPRAPLLNAALAAGHIELQTWSVTLGDDDRDELRALGFQPAPPEAGARTQPGMLLTSTDRQPAEDWAIDGVPLLDATRWQLRMANSDAS